MAHTLEREDFVSVAISSSLHLTPFSFSAVERSSDISDTYNRPL